MKLNTKKNTAEVFNSSEFDYTEYLREYYNRMLRGEERIPSAKEVSFFFQELFSSMSKNSLSRNSCVDLKDDDDIELDFKQKMVA